MAAREIMEYDVVVGAGQARLAFAVRMKQLDTQASVCALEKASTIGAQIRSGAVIEPAPRDALPPGWRDNPPPICVPATHDEFQLLRDPARAKRLPTPPQMHNAATSSSASARCARGVRQPPRQGFDA